jgi:hypothetical protein
MDHNPLDATLQSSPLRASGFHLHQDLRPGTEQKLHHTRESTPSAVQGPQEGEIQRARAFQRVRYEGLALRPPVRLLHRKGLLPS